MLSFLADPRPPGGDRAGERSLVCRWQFLAGFGDRLLLRFEGGGGGIIGSLLERFDPLAVGVGPIVAVIGGIVIGVSGRGRCGVGGLLRRIVSAIGFSLEGGRSLIPRRVVASLADHRVGAF